MKRRNVAWILQLPKVSRIAVRRRIMPQMFSEIVLAHFQNPRNSGDLSDATAVIEVTNPVCGDVLKLSARLENGVVTAARFKAQGCVASIAAASVLTEQLAGKSLQDAKKITPAQISEALGGLPPTTLHAAQLCCDAVAALLRKINRD